MLPDSVGLKGTALTFNSIRSKCRTDIRESALRANFALPFSRSRISLAIMLAVAGSLALGSSQASADGGNGLSVTGAGVGGLGGADGSSSSATGQNGGIGTVSGSYGSGGGGALDLTTGNGAAGGAAGLYGTVTVYGASGATGTVGMVVTSQASISNTISGGAGQIGQAAVANVNSAGGNGGGGAGVQASADITVTGTGVVTGGMGAVLTAAGGGGGGAGIFSSANVTIDAGGKVTGGAGSTTLTGASGGGGEGGAAVVLTGSGTVTNSGTLTGGNGERSFVGAGGDGGAGIEVVSGGTVFNESGGTVTGGNGGGGVVRAFAVPVAPGAGGAGITGSNVTVINAGTIAGGTGGTGAGWTPVSGDAVLFTGGVNSLEIWSTSHLTGNAVAFSAADTLKLGGATNSSFDVSQIGAKGSAAQYQGFGLFEKTGTSTWTLTGTTSAVTPWTLTGGVLQISSDSNLGDASGGLTFNGGTLENTANLTMARGVTMVANGTLLTDGSTTLTMNGTISGAGALTKNGAGTLVLAGDNTYTGGTIIDAGTVQIGNGGTRGSIVGNVVNNGVLLLDRSGALTLDGAISGAGSVTQLGSGTTILSGNNSYTGGTIIASGTLQLGNGGASGSIVGDITDNGALAFNRSDALVFDNVISGSGAVNQVGTGTTILNAANTFAGGTNVLAGTLAVGDPAHTSASIGTGLTTVAVGASLGGYGSVPASVNNHGTLAVANALQSFATSGSGTLRIGGDLNNAGVVNLAAASGQTGNVLNVAGNYTGTNGQVVLNAVLNQSGTITQGDRLVIVGNASGSTALRVNGSSSGTTTTGDGIQLVQVNGTSGANSFHLAGPVQAGAYEYLLYQGGTADANSWYLRSQLESTAAGTTSPSGTTGNTSAPIAYRPAVTGYAMTPLLVTDYGFTMLGRLQERVGDVASVEAAKQPASKNGVWGRIGGQNLDADAGDRFSADERTFFAQFGKDWTLSRGENGGSTHAGATVSFGSTSASFADSARSLTGQLTDATGTVETQAQSVGGYWTKYLPDGTYFDGVGQLTHYQNQYGDVYGGSGRQNGFGAGVSGEAGKPFALGSSGIAIEPQAQLLYQYVHLNHFNDGISEVGANTTNALRGRLGFRLFKANLSNDAKNSTLTPYLMANVLHDFFSPGQTRVGGATLQNELGKTWYDIGVGVTGSFGKNSTAYANVSYAHSIGGDYRRNVFGQAGYRFSW